MFPEHLRLLRLLRRPAEDELRRVEVLAHDGVDAGALARRESGVGLLLQTRVEGHLGELRDDLLHERALLLGDDGALELGLRRGLARRRAADARRGHGPGAAEVAAPEVLATDSQVRLLGAHAAVVIRLLAAAEEAGEAVHGGAPRASVALALQATEV